MIDAPLWYQTIRLQLREGCYVHMHPRDWCQLRDHSAGSPGQDIDMNKHEEPLLVGKILGCPLYANPAVTEGTFGIGSPGNTPETFKVMAG